MKPVSKTTAVVGAAIFAVLAVNYDNDPTSVDRGVTAVVEPASSIMGGVGDLARVTASEAGGVAAIAGGAAQGAGNGAQNDGVRVVPNDEGKR